MPNKIKILKSVIKTRAQLEALVHETVSLQIDRESRIAERDAALLALNERFNPAIDTLGEHLETNVALIENWAEANSEEFGNERSIAIDGHRLGWRLGNPAVKPVKKLTWKAVVAGIEKLGGEIAKQFLRTKVEPNKEAMLAAARLDENALDEIGVEVVQTETFYLDPAREGQPDTRLTTEAKAA